MIIFRNPGVLDPRAITIFGVNVKADPKSAIGYFGTGLKYAIAVLLRHGCSISIHTGGENYTFDLGVTEIRNKAFSIVRMNGKELGFTNELGKNWELWMAYRELYSNALDEKGGSEQTYNLASLMVNDNETVVMVDGAEFEVVHSQRDKYFLNRDARSLVARNEFAECFKKQFNDLEDGIIFYKGVRVATTGIPSYYDYNLLGEVELTEDRTIRWGYQIKYLIGGLPVSAKENKLWIRQITMLPTNETPKFEHTLNYNSYCGPAKPTDFWLNTVGELRKETSDCGLQMTAIELHKRHREKSVLPEKSIELNPVEQVQYDRAIDFCKNTLQMPIDRFPIIIAESLGSNSLRLADFGICLT